MQLIDLGMQKAQEQLESQSLLIDGIFGKKRLIQDTQVEENESNVLEQLEHYTKLRVDTEKRLFIPEVNLDEMAPEKIVDIKNVNTVWFAGRRIQKY